MLADPVARATAPGPRPDGGEADRGPSRHAAGAPRTLPPQWPAVRMVDRMKLCCGRLRLVMRVAEQVVGELEHGAQSRERGTEHVFGTLRLTPDGTGP